MAEDHDDAGYPLLTPLTAEEWADDEYAAVGALLGYRARTGRGPAQEMPGTR